tara:strand:+ start:883 stop:1419 length:537 start_codon:yes stop_codon:yes gene_type:complete
MSGKTKSDECLELKNIKYQTMLINNNTSNFNTKENINDIEDFLFKEIQLNKNLPWSKLDQGLKLKHIRNFVKDYTLKNKLSENKEKILLKFLNSCMERKKLQRVKDVTYDISSGKIICIPNLLFNKVTNKFILKKKEKSGSSTLSCLAPKPKSKRRKQRKLRKTKALKEKAKALKEGV